MHCNFGQEQEEIDLEVKIEDVTLHNSMFKYISLIS